MAWRLVRKLAGIALVLSADSASAGLIDFNEADAFAWAGESIQSGGYSFLAVSQGPLSFLQVDSQSDIVGNGSRRLLSGNHTGISMTLVDGGKFDLLGLSFGGSWTDPAKRERWADAIEIVGNFGGGSTVKQQLDLSSLPASLHSASLNNFLGVESVSFRPLRFGPTEGSDFEFVLDDIRVASVPEPETWLLLGAGLALLALRRHRRG